MTLFGGLPSVPGHKCGSQKTPSCRKHVYTGLNSGLVLGTLVANACNLLSHLDGPRGTF